MTTEQKLLRITHELWSAFLESTKSSPFDKDDKDDINDFRHCIHQLQRIIATRSLYDVTGKISLQKIESLEPRKPFKPGPRQRKQKVQDDEPRMAPPDFETVMTPKKKSKGKDEELE